MSNTTNEKNNATVVEAEIISEPVVSEQDFPQKSSRLEGLIQQFRKDGVPFRFLTNNSSNTNPLAQVKVKPGVKIKTYETLKPAEQQKVLQRVNGVDYTVLFQ